MAPGRGAPLLVLVALATTISVDAAPRVLLEAPPVPKDDELVVYDEPAELPELAGDDEPRDLRRLVATRGAPAAPDARASAADRAVTVWDKHTERLPSNWTHDSVAALVGKTPFLSADGDTVFTGRVDSNVVSEAELCDENDAVVCTRQPRSDAPLFGRTTWTLEASDAASGELRWRATTSAVSDRRVGAPAFAEAAPPAAAVPPIVLNGARGVVPAARGPPALDAVEAPYTHERSALIACALALVSSDSTALVAVASRPPVLVARPAGFLPVAVLGLLCLGLAFFAGRRDAGERVPRIVASAAPRAATPPPRAGPVVLRSAAMAPSVARNEPRVDGFFGAKRASVVLRRVANRADLAREIGVLQTADHAAIVRFYACDVVGAEARVALEAHACTVAELVGAGGFRGDIQRLDGEEGGLLDSLRRVAEALAWLRTALPTAEGDAKWRATPDSVALVPRDAGGARRGEDGVLAVDDAFRTHDLKLVPLDAFEVARRDATTTARRDVWDLARLAKFACFRGVDDAAARAVADASDDARLVEVGDMRAAGDCASPGAWAQHCALWTDARRSDFLCDLSDYAEERPGDAAALRDALDGGGGAVLGAASWLDGLDPALRRRLEKRRTYDGSSVLALLRALRNGRHHRHELGAEGPGDGATLERLSRAFPRLVAHCFRAGHAALDDGAPADLAAALAYFGPRPRRREPPRTLPPSPRADDRCPPAAAPRGGGYRTRLCKHWLESGGSHCPMSARGLPCAFAHGEAELRSPDDAPRPRPQRPRPRKGSRSPPRPASASAPAVLAT